VTAVVPSCFHEADPGVALARRAAAEGLGTTLLMFAASAAGLAATRLLPGQPGVAVVLVAFAVAGALVSLIVAFGRFSGGRYNPLITVLQLVAGERLLVCALVYVALQLAGGLVSGALAAVVWHAAPSGAGGMGLDGESIASAGLILVVFGTTKSGRPAFGPFAVGAWLVAAVIATPTSSYANPAVVLGAMLSAGPIALGSGSVVPYIGAEVAGAFLALGIISIIFPVKATKS
jgi:glycerol uptake facilitator-like aquaporin